MKRINLILLALLVSSTNGKKRKTVPGEITPVSVEGSGYHWSGNKAIDRKIGTSSVAGAGSDGIPWLKVKLGQVYCIDRVVVYWDFYSYSNSSWSCTREECTCERGCDTVPHLLAVFIEYGYEYWFNPTSAADLPSTTRCKLGDAVKITKVPHMGHISVDEVVITSPQLADCSALDSTWENVVTDPQLPVEHGTAIALGCTAGRTNIGGNRASCQHGQIDPTDEPPQCAVPCHYSEYRDTTTTQCAACPAGQQPNSDQSGCDPCSAGTYKQDPMTTCTVCPENTISEQEGATSCIDCDTGTVSHSERTHCADCTALDSTWENVVTDPQLPVEHGTAITLGCTTGHTNIGGSQATCQNGQIDPTAETPQCRADCTALDSTWENVVTDPQLPVEHGTAITLGCTAGHTNTGGETATCQNGQIDPTAETPQCLVMCQDSNTFHRIRAIAFKEARDAFLKELKKPGGPNPDLFSKSWISRKINRSETFVKKNWKRDPYDPDC